MEILHWKLSIAPKGCRTPPAKKLDPAWCSPKMQTLCSFLFSLPRVTFAFKLEFEIIEKDKLPRAQLSGARFILASSSSGFSFEQLFPPGFRDLFERQGKRSKRRKTSDQAARPREAQCTFSKKNSIRRRVLYHHYPRLFEKKKINWRSFGFGRKSFLRDFLETFSTRELQT